MSNLNTNTNEELNIETDEKTVESGKKKFNKKQITILSILLVAVALITTLVVVLVNVFKDEPDPTPSGAVSGDEIGVYYSTGNKECELTLKNGCLFDIRFDGVAEKGSYILNGSTLTLDFDSEGSEDVVASYNGDVVTMTYKGTALRMLKKVNYTVKFVTNGGTEIDAATVLNGKTVTKPLDPTKEGYLFIGWYKDAKLTVPFTFSADVITADTSVYAGWTEDNGAEEYKISFDLGYDNAEVIAPMNTIGAKLFNAPTPAARDGYVFSGWWISTDNDASRLSYEWAQNTVFRADTTLFALWRANNDTTIAAPSISVDASGIKWNSISGARSYEVTVFDSNGTSVLNKATQTTSVSFAFGDYAAGVYSIKVVAIAKTVSEDNSESFYTYVNKGLDKVGGFFVSGGSTLVFEGVENAEKYLITVLCGNSNHNHTDFDNGNSKTFSFANCPMSKEGISFVVKAVADGYLTSVSDVFVYKKALDSVSEFVFSEETGILTWSAVENAEHYVALIECSNPAHNHSLTKIITDSSIDIRECSSSSGAISVKVYPVANGYYSPAAEEFEITKTSLATPSGIKVNGTVVSWNTDSDAEKYEISVNGQIYQTTDNSFDVSSISAETYTVKIRALGLNNSPWSDEIDCHNLTLDSVKYFNSTLSWSHVIGADYYEVKINGGSVITVDGVNYTAIALDRAGENTLSVRFVYGESYSEWSSITVNAYSVAFDTLGGSAEIPTQFKAQGDIVYLPTANKTGYKFVGWYNALGGASVNGKELEDIFSVTENVVIYAYYTPKEYSITYEYGLDGSGLGLQGSVKYEMDYTLEIPVANKNVIAFGGWFSEPYGKGTQYTDGSGQSIMPWSIAGDATVYAFWIDEALSFTSVKVNGKEAYSVSMGARISLVTEVTVPAYYNGIKVAMIDGNAFSGCKNLKVINIPSTIEVISNLDPFDNCTSLVEINVYDVEGVTTSRYISDSGVLFENTTDSVKLLRMPAGYKGEYVTPSFTTEIAEGAFIGSSVSSVVISEGITKIGADAFSGCASLESITFAVPSSDAKELTIGKRAFMNCTALNSIVLPARLTSIDLSKYYIDSDGKFKISSDYSFTGCDSLGAINVAADSSEYSVVDGMIYSADKRQLIYCPVAKSGAITLASGTQYVSAGAFIGCDGITEIFIPNTVTYVGEYAFYGLSVGKVTFGGKGFNSVTIGDNAFEKCEKLSEVILESGSQISVIGEKAFSGCNSLERFTISSSVTAIRNNAFENCANLSEVVFEGGKSALEFGTNVFNNCARLTTVKIPQNVAKIPGIFGGCSSLTEVEIDKNNPYFVSLNGVVFNKDMTEIVYYPQGKGGEYTIPDTVSVIAAGVFSGNQSLTKLIIPNTVSYIGEEAFKNTKIGKITFEGDVYADELIIAKSAFQGAYLAVDDTKFVLPKHTKSIGDYAFSGIYYKNIELNEGLETIGDYAFYLPSNVDGATLVIPASVISIGEYCFGGESTDYSSVSFNRFVKVEFTLENAKLETIGDFAFYKNARLESVVLPSSVKSIGNYAFCECTNLSAVTLSESLETIGAYAFAASAYTYQVPISSVTIPKNVSKIGARAFENCQLLTYVTFEGTVSSPDLYLGTSYRRSYTTDGIEMFSMERGHVFASCTRLVEVNLSANVTVLDDGCFMSSGDIGFSVNIPENSRLTTIGAYCFYKSRLVSFTVPASVRNLDPVEEDGVVRDRLGIGEYAFAATSGKLTQIVFLKDDNFYPLTIGYGAFENQSNLTTIELPARLTTYRSASGEVLEPLANGPLVFYGTDSLSNITVESSDKAYYTVVSGVLYNADKTQLVFCPISVSGDILVPATVLSIYDYAFCGCSKINSVTFAIGSKLLSIGNYAFYACSSITELIIPSDVVLIGEGAFNNARNLSTITLPKSLTSFDVSALNGCTSLKQIVVENGNVSFKSDSGVLYNYDKTELLLYPAGREDKKYTVAENTVVIGKNAFSANALIESVVLPSTLVEIKDGAFANCTALKTVTIPKTVTLIGSEAFANTTSIESVSFENGGTESLIIGNGAFRGSSLGAVEMPSRLAVIGSEAFMNSQISVLTFEVADSYRLSIIEDNAFYGTKLNSLKLPAGVTTIGNGAFFGTASLESVELGEGLESIGNEAFKNSTVKTVYLPSTLKQIGTSAFYGCAWLSEVEFASGSQLRVISAGAFYGCTALKSITIPAFVEEIGGKGDNGAFQGCTSLVSVIFESDDYCTVIDDYAFYGCSALSNFDIPLACGTLGNYAFAGCTSLTDIVINRATVKLGAGLFSGCTSLKSVELNTGAALLPEKMFENCISLTYVHIPASVTEIADKCFSGTGIQQFGVAKENRNFVSVSGILYNYHKTEIICLPPKLTTQVLVIPKEVVTIRNSNFEGCTSIKEVIFEEGGTVPLSIGEKAFLGCYQLRNLVLPERLVSIGRYAFKECYALTSVTIPKNVTSIGDSAFTWCHKLYEVRNESDIENIKNKGSIAIAQSKVNVYTPTEGASVLSREGDFLFATIDGVKTLIGYEGWDSVVILPTGSYTVADYLFYYDTSITRVIIPDTNGINFNVSQAFSNCTNLEAILIGSKSAPSGWNGSWNGKIKVVYGFTGEKVTYSFVTNGADAIDSVTSDSIISLPVPIRDGFVFIGWYDNAEFNGEAFNGEYYNSEKTTLYARFMSESEYIETYLRGQSMEYAYTVESGTTYSVKIQNKGDQNYYAVNVTAGDKWNISTPGGTGSHKIYIYDSNGNLILSYSSATTYNVDFDYVFTKDGTYYIGVGYKDSKKTGNFEVTITEK